MIANGGDLAREVGFWPAFAATPEEAPTFSPAIVVYEPARNSTAEGRIRIRGDARTFEANVVFDLLSERGEEIASGFTTARVAAPIFGRFDAELPFSIDQPQRGILRVYELSAATGELINVVLIPLNLR